MTQPFASAHVKAELDWNNLDAELLARVRVAARKAEAALRAHFAQVQLATGVKLTANAANFRTEARKALAKISLDTAVTLTPRLGNFRAQARAALAAVALTHDVTLTVNSATLPRDVRQALREIANNFDFEIKIRAVPDFSRFPADVLRSLAEIRRNFNFEIPIRAALDDAAARAALDRLTRDRTVDVNVRRRGSLGDLGSGGGLGGLNLSSLAKGTAIASAVAAAIAAIGGAAGVAVGAISGLALALASLGPVAVAGIATAAVGLKGLGDAFKATSAASQSSAADSKAAQDAIASASRNVADAEKAVKQAKKDSRTAEQDLTRARKDAQKAARDLNLEVRGGVLSEVEAQLDLKDTREELANLKPGDDYQRAQLRVAQAEQSLLETRFRNSDLAEKKAEADAKGIEGSDQVVAAQERVEAASDNVASAEQRLIDANKALADATSQTSAAQDKAAQAMAKLSPNAQAFVLATRALGPAWTDLRKSVQDKMFEGLDESITSLANAALPSLKEGMGTVATSLNGLTRGFMDFWSQTQNLDAVEQIFAGTATFIDAIGPGLQQMTTGFLAFGQAAAAQAAPLGAAFGNVLGSIGQALTNAFADGSLTAALGGVASLLNGLASGLEPLIGGLIDMVAIMGPSLGSLLTSLGTALGAIAPVLGQIGVVFADTLVAIMPQLTSFINALMTGLAPVLPVIGQLLGSIMTALTPMIGPLSQIAQIVGVALAQAFLALAPAIGPLSNAIVALIGAIAPIIPVVAQVVAGLITAFAPALTTIFQALGPVIAQIAGLMLPIFQQLQPILAQVAGQIAGALVKAIEQLAPHIPAIATAFGDLVMAIAPMIPQLVEIALSLLPPLLDVVIALLPQFQKFIEVLTWLVRNVIEPYVIPYVKQMVDSLATGLETVATVITTVRDKIGGALQAIGGFFGDMKTAGGAAMDGLILGVALGVKALGKLLQRVKIPDWVPGVGGKGTESLGNSLVEWAEAKGAAQGGRVVGREVRRAASGGRLISGPGTGTSDSIPALLNGITPLRVANGEFISTAKAVEAGAPLLWALNAGWAPSPEMTRMLLGWNSAPGFAGGGMITDNEIARMGGGSVNLSLWKAIKAKVPGAVLTSAKTDHDIDGGFHPKGQAIDVAPSRDVLDYLWANRSQLSQIIYDDPAKVWYNVNGERAEGAKARAIYGESTMAGHADHIHVAAAQDFRDTGVEAGADTGATDTRTEKQKIVDEIVSVGKEMGMSDADITAAIATGLVESELQDLDYGDRDSDGVFQQRPSQGWGSADDTVAKDARDFFERYRETDPSLSAGERAQAVQRSAYPDKYGQRMDEAATLYQESQTRAKSTTTTGGTSSSTSSGVQQVAVTNWPSNLGSSSSSAASSALSSSATSSTPSTSTLSTSTPTTTTDTGVPSTGAPTYGIAAANDWASKQNFQRQFEDVGVSALASFAGEFGDLFGLKSQAESAVTDGVTNLRNWASTVKVAETMNFYGYDANQVATETGRMLERMTPVSETYRNG